MIICSLLAFLTVTPADARPVNWPVITLYSLKLQRSLRQWIPFANEDRGKVPQKPVLEDQGRAIYPKLQVTLSVSHPKIFL